MYMHSVRVYTMYMYVQNVCSNMSHKSNILYACPYTQCIHVHVCVGNTQCTTDSYTCTQYIVQMYVYMYTCTSVYIVHYTMYVVNVHSIHHPCTCAAHSTALYSVRDFVSHTEHGTLPLFIQTPFNKSTYDL